MELKHTAARDGRLSSFLREEMRMSAGLVNRLKWQEKLFVNGQSRHTDYPVTAGDVITVPLEEPEPEYPAEDGAISVLYEDQHLLAVDKPAGMLIHPSRTRMTGTLANRVVGYYRKTGQKSAFHPVTRLDRDTYGVVLIAKNAYVHALLGEHPMEKVYHGVVYGCPEVPEGTVDAPIARLPLPSLLREVRPDGKPCLTRYRVLERRGHCSRLALQPITGRTHQLRVHCAFLGCPMVGDPQYGTPESTAFSRENGAGSQLLCAKSLRLFHPVTGEPLELCSRLDADFFPEK